MQENGEEFSQNQMLTIVNSSIKITKPRGSCDSLNKSTASSSSDVTVIPKNKAVSFGDTLARHGFRKIQI